MKVAICSQGPDLASPVDDRFGRCAYFVFVDPSTNVPEAVPNPGVGAAHGAGTSAAQLLVKHGADAVLAGNIGPNPAAVLEAAGIKVHTGMRGAVKDALYDYLAGRLLEASGPSVPSHAGLGRGRTGLGGSSRPTGPGR